MKKSDFTPPNVRKTAERTFTLIELLIVVAIIAILAGMLLPALNKARDRAKAIDCTGKIKQINTAMFSYLGDHDGVYPPSYWHSGNYCQTMLRQYLGLGEKGMRDKAVQGSFRCPAQPDWSTTWDGTSYAYNGMYFGYAGYTLGSNPITPVRASQIKQASQLLVFVEAWYSQSSTAYRRQGRSALSSGDLQRVAFRHSHRTNTAYADGHVALEDVSQVADVNEDKLPWNKNRKFEAKEASPGYYLGIVKSYSPY